MGARVLVVEDNQMNLALMEYLLQAFGHTVRVATDGAAGVAVALADPPDLVLMDLQMPVLNGFEAVGQLKADARFAGVPVIAVTAQAMVGDRDRVLMHGFDGYVSKPITPETFVQEIERFLPAALRSSPRSEP
jgi:CheY-like chemotaxis protein